MVNINHRVGIKAPVEKVYESLSTPKGISEWWTKDSAGDSQKGKSITVKFHNLEGSEIGSMNFLLMELIPGKQVRWKFTAGPPEWINTEVVFDLHQVKEYTIVLFSHNNWLEEVEFKSHCSMRWAIFLLSLKQYLENGKGSPSPGDIKIDNWN